MTPRAVATHRHGDWAVNLSERVTIVHQPAPVPDGYRNPTYDWSTADRDVDVPASLQPRIPRRGAEDDLDRQASFSEFRLFLSPTAAIESTARVEAYGVTYEVAGDPHLWRRNGQPHHLTVLLERIAIS